MVLRAYLFLMTRAGARDGSQNATSALGLSLQKKKNVLSILTIICFWFPGWAKEV